MAWFAKAEAAYLCATLGHLWTWTTNQSYGPPPKGCACLRCGAEKKT